MKIINESLLQKFREESCELCGKAPPSEPHHLFCRGIGGGGRLDVPINLIALCHDCHNDAQGNSRVLAMLCHVVVRREVWALRRTSK